MPSQSNTEKLRAVTSKKCSASAGSLESAGGAALRVAPRRKPGVGDLKQFLSLLPQAGAERGARSEHKNAFSLHAPLTLCVGRSAERIGARTISARTRYIFVASRL